MNIYANCAVEQILECTVNKRTIMIAAGIASREPKWQRYHREVHTLSTDLAGVARQAQPKLLVTYHRIYHMNIQDNRQNLRALAFFTRRHDYLLLREERESKFFVHLHFRTSATTCHVLF